MKIVSALVTLVLMARVASAQVPTPERREELLRNFPQLHNEPDRERQGYIFDPTIRLQAAPAELERAYTDALALLSLRELERANADANLASARRRETARADDLVYAQLALAAAQSQLDRVQRQSPPSLDGGSGPTLEQARKAVQQAEAAVATAKTQLTIARAERTAAEEKATQTADEFRRVAGDALKARNSRNAKVPDEFLQHCSVAGMAIQRNTILVRFANTATMPEIETILRLNDVHVVAGMPEISLFLVELNPPARSNETDDEHRLRLTRTIDAMRGSAPHVTSAAPQVVLHGASMNVLAAITLRPCWSWFDADDNGSASADLMRLPLAWDFLSQNRPAGGTAVPVAILDTGFVPNDDLPNVAATCAAVRGTHGNQVAGLLDGAAGNHKVSNGAAPVAQISGCAVPIVPFLCGGDAAVAFTTIAFALRDLLTAQSPRVVNMSVGYNWKEEFLRFGSSDTNVQAIVNAQGSIVRDLLASFEEKAVIVSAAGNECNGAPCKEPAMWASPANWAALAPVDPLSGIPQSRNVIVVGSVGRTGTRSGFSSRDDSVQAPGERLLTCQAGTASAADDGTSLSAPIVSGIAAMMIARNPSLKPQQVVRILRETNENRSTVDALTAVERAAAPPP
jgi:hypothetical protein